MNLKSGGQTSTFVPLSLRDSLITSSLPEARLDLTAYLAVFYLLCSVWTLQLFYENRINEATEMSKSN